MTNLPAPMQLLAQTTQTAPSEIQLGWTAWLELTWIAISAVVIINWAIRTRLGWTRLQNRPVRHNLLQLPVVVIFFVAAYFILPQAVVLVTYPVLAGRVTQYQQLLIVNFVAQVIQFAGTIWLVQITFYRGSQSLGLVGRPILRDALLGIGVMFVLLPLLGLVMQLTNLFWKVQPHPIIEQMKLDRTMLTAWLSAATAIVGAPLAEEIIFRGLIQNYLVRFFRLMMPPKGWPGQTLSLTPPEVQRWQARQAIARAEAMGEQPPADLQVPPEPGEAGGQVEPLSPSQEARRAIATIFVSALIFAGIHYAMPTSLPTIFVLALGLGYIYETTGSLVCTIAMHASFNAFNLIGFMLTTYSN